MSFPNRSRENSRIIFQGRVDIVTGLPALFVTVSMPNVIISCDNSGNNEDYSNTKAYFYVYKGGVLQTGWAFQTITNNGISYNWGTEYSNLYINITGTTLTDTGYIDVVLSKTGESPLYARLSYTKVYKGDTGATGSTGSTGSTGVAGPAGPTGNDGTGLVVVKKVISVDAGTTVTKQDYGDGNLQLNYSSAHGLVLGEFVRVVQSGIYDINLPITEVVDSDSIKLDVAYDATAGTVTAFDMKNFQLRTLIESQFVAFKDIIPHGAKVLEAQLFCSNDNSGVISNILVKLGVSYTGNLTAVIGNWINNESCYQEGVVIAKDRRTTILMNLAGDYSLYLEAQPNMQQWDTDLANYELELFVAYINYGPTWTP